jgi:hypothetical protein
MSPRLFELEILSIHHLEEYSGAAIMLANLLFKY